MKAARSRLGRYAAVLAVAAAVRVLWAILIPVVPVSDCVIYDGAAQRLAQGLPYTIDAASSRSAHWPVGTSFMYSLVYRVFDPQSSGYTAVTVVNVLISLAVVGLAMGLATRWFGARAGTVTGVLLAFWPMHIEFTTIIASEPIFTACIMAGLLAWPDARDRSAGLSESYGRIALAALFFGMATYTRPTSLLIPIILGGIEAVRNRSFIRPAFHAGLAMLILLVALSPWTYRNYCVFGKLVLVSTNGGTNMWMGNNPDTTGFYQAPPAADDGKDEAAWDKELGNRAKVYIREKPVAFIKRTLVKAVRLHDRETIGVAWNLEGLKRRFVFFNTGPGARILKVISSGYWYLMLSLAAAGGLMLARRDGPWNALTHPTVVLFAYFTAVHAIMVIQDRYHFPITPLVAALASLSVSAMLNLRSATNSAPA